VKPRRARPAGAFLPAAGPDVKCSCSLAPGNPGAGA